MAVYVAYIMNLFIPRSGEVSRALVINKYEGVPFDKAFGTIISERVVDVLFLFGFTGMAFLLQFEKEICIHSNFRLHCTLLSL